MKSKMKKSLLFVVSALALISTIGAFRVYDTHVTKAENAVSFEMDYGASIRGNEPTGIRFKTKMNDAYDRHFPTARNCRRERLC